MIKLALLLTLALAGAITAPAPDPPGRPDVNRITRIPTTTKDLVNAYFPPEIWPALWLEDYDAIDKAKASGWLVDIPNDPQGLGIQLQLTGDFPIAQAEPDPKLKQKLLRLTKPAAGLLLDTIEFLRGEEGENFYPVTPTSLVRPWQYTLKLIPLNANADVFAQGVPPTHVFGLAFDLTRLKMTHARDELLGRHFQKLKDQGKIIFYPEGQTQANYHAIALLQNREEFEADYDRLIKLRGSKTPHQ